MIWKSTILDGSIEASTVHCFFHKTSIECGWLLLKVAQRLIFLQLLCHTSRLVEGTTTVFTNVSSTPWLWFELSLEALKSESTCLCTSFFVYHNNYYYHIFPLVYYWINQDLVLGVKFHYLATSFCGGICCAESDVWGLP